MFLVQLIMVALQFAAMSRRRMKLGFVAMMVNQVCAVVGLSALIGR